MTERYERLVLRGGTNASGTAEAWATKNPVLECGEPGFEVDTGNVKIGDGVRAWVDLPYSALAEAGLNAAYASKSYAEQKGARVGLRWVPFGDSLTSETAGGNGRGNWTNMVTMGTDARAVVYYNAGVYGNNAADLRARMQTDVISKAPNLSTLWIGVNDISQARPLADYQADVVDILSRYRDENIPVAVLSIPPRDDITKLDTITVWNKWIKTYCRDNAFDYIDVFGALVDPATGKYKTGLGDVDGLHLSCAGHKAVADTVVAALSAKIPAGGVLLPDTNVDGTNMLANPLMMLNSDAAPTQADGWTFTSGNVTTGHTLAVVDDADFRGGKAQEVALVNPNGFHQMNQNIANTTGKWAAGDRLLFVVRVKITAASGVTRLKGLRVSANFYGSASPINVVVERLREAGISGIVAKEYTVPADTTTPVQFAVVGDIDATASMTYRVGEAAIFNLTRLGLA